MHYSDLDQLLSSSGPFTFFAPSDLAFEKQGNSFMEDLLTPAKKEQLTDLLNSHIVNGSFSLIDMKDGDKLTTLNGKELMVGVRNGNVNIDGKEIVSSQKKISNGVIHSTDTVFIKK